MQRRKNGSGRSYGALFAAALAKQRTGRAAEAVALYEQALRVNASAPEACNNLGCALLALGRLEDAATALARAVALRPGYVEALDTLGLVLAQLGRHAEAVSAFERALGATPSVDVAVHLGNSLLALERFADARAAFERAVAASPSSAAAHNGLGVALARAGDDPGAITAFAAALAADPAFGDAACNMGRVCLEAGDLDAAARWFERAVTIDPGNGHYALQFVRSRREPPDAARLAAMEALAGGRGLSPSGRIELHFALAKAYEDAGRFDDAFRHLAAGNRLKRAELAYVEAGEIGLMDRLARAIDRPFIEALRGTGHPSERPVFVFGMARSGSTLVEQILAAHPAVAGAGESGTFGRLIVATPPPIGPGAPGPAVAAALRSLAERYLQATDDVAASAARLTDKTLANFTLAPLLHVALPNARLIHVRRDPLDTCLSCFATLFLGNYVPFSYDLDELGRYYRAYERTMAHWRAILPPERFLEVDYEDVVADLEAQARRIVAFCELPWDDACLAFHTARRPVRTASAFQVRQPLYASAVGRAAHFAAHLQPLVAALHTDQPAGV